MSTDKDAPATATDTPFSTPRRRVSHRGKIMCLLLALFLLAGAGAAAWWYLVLRFEESTDDAYVAGNVLRIMPEVAGTVVSVEADDNDIGAIFKIFNKNEGITTH